MKKRKLISICTILIIVLALTIGTYAYFRRTVNGNITGQTGNLVLVVNDSDSSLNETFTIPFNENNEYVMPGDRGTFDLNIDLTGSTGTVAVTINVEKIDLPDNLKFYLDENLKKELTNKTFYIHQSDSMTKKVPVYWYWNGRLNSENDNEYINSVVEATINVSATIVKFTNLFNELISNATLDTNVDFTVEPSIDNGQGLMMLNATQNDEYPIVYYRGDVSNNNVIFGEFCWLIVRTTETGGTKLIYNGEVNSDGSCNNYSGVTSNVSYNSELAGAYINQLINSFNNNNMSPVYAGYMYNDVVFDMSSIDDINTFVTKYKDHLADNTVDSTTGRHVQNLKDSNVKNKIDNWYKNNINGTEIEKILEDSIWCNDRSISSNFTLEDFASNGTLGYGAYDRLLVSNVQLTCSRAIDKFTVDSNKGNGDLDYPIGLLTTDEANLAGHIAETLTNTYLSIPNGNYWYLTPIIFIPEQNMGTIGGVFSEGTINIYPVNLTAGIRPSIVLNNSAEFLEGNGSFEKPYNIIVY